MKRYSVLIIVGLVMSVMLHNVQAQLTQDSLRTIHPHPIAVSYHQTMNLIFPYAIKSVDRGSNSILVQKAKGVDNILQVKAGAKEFVPTNLSVVTAEGKFYSFTVSYAELPAILNLSFTDNGVIQLHDHPTSERQLEQASWQVLGMPTTLGLKSKDPFTALHLQGAYLSAGQLWLRLQVVNYSSVDFRTDYLRFFLQGKKQSKRTAILEKEMSPVFSKRVAKVPGGETAVFVVGFTPFTLPKHQRLVIQLGEDEGGRTMQLKVKAKWLLRARKMAL